MKRSRLYKIIIAVLVIINVGMLVFMWMGPPPPHGKPEPLQEILGLKGENKSKLEGMETVHHKEKRRLMAKDRKLHETLFSKLGTDEDVSELQAEIEANHAEIEKMTFEYFNEVAKLCNAEQLTELKKLIRHAFVSMRKPPEGKK
jgi:hypothetical protein